MTNKISHDSETPAHGLQKGIMKERHKAVPAAYLILIKNGEILLGRRINTGYYDGWCTVPSGHIEAGELPLNGLLREAQEEIGITFDKENARLVHTMYRIKHDETGDRADYFFVLDTWSGELQNMEPHKCDELRWFPLDDLPENLMHHVGIALNLYQQGVVYSEVPFNEKFINPNIRQ